MLTPFNREELLLTYDLNRFNQVRYALEAAGLDYQYRTKDLASPTIFSSRGRTGTFAMNNDARVEYKLYVRREELEPAQALLRGVN